ncbi:hypothetical protein [Methanocella conradii]|uniref:hypothetical protein n=1 Tax=Methanocella conradii TaxID=1175444 RepID=UPI00157CA437|nr:hypothetical protein [Methanocella conradii]
MAEEQKPFDIEELKKELADIKSELMRKELEEIKHEKMRQELEELKAEQAQKHEPQRYSRLPRLSIITALMAVLTLVMAGYMLGTLFTYNLAGDIDKYIASYNYPISGSMVVAIVSVVLIFIGLGFVTMAKR